MNCARVEKSLPLYVRGDLEAAAEGAVSAHLLSCEHCAHAADEYREAQEWMRLYAPPAFDNEFFAGIRRNVRQELGREEAPHWLLQLFRRPFAQRALAAASLALLLISVTFVYFAGRGRASDEAVSEAEGVASVAAPASDTPAPPVSTGGPGRSTQAEAVAAGTRNAARPKRGPAPSVRPDGARRERAATRTPAAVNQGSSEGAGSDAVAMSIAEASGPGGPRYSLRVEMQTRDPNIRVIWLTPEEDKAGRNKEESKRK